MSQREWAPIIAALNAGDALDYDQSYWLMDQVMSGELGDARLASFLTAMAIKGATVAEIHGLADGMADHATPVDLPGRALDIVGTGGDGYKTVNVSTMSAIVLAAMGSPRQHGNRASTSKSGSADVIERSVSTLTSTRMPYAASSMRWASPSSSPTRCIPRCVSPRPCAAPSASRRPSTFSAR